MFCMKLLFTLRKYLSGADKQHEYAEPYTAFPSSRQVKNDVIRSDCSSFLIFNQFSVFSFIKSPLKAETVG